MGPVFVDSATLESQLSDEEYVIFRAKSCQKQDDATSKAWMITAKTLFPRNFQVQLEAYTSQKTAKNSKEAARHFSSLFFDFPNEPGLWEEAHGITESLQPSADASSQFHRELFANMLPEVQHKLLLAMAERAQDTLEHCRLMLVLLSRLPQSIDSHGKKLIDTLLIAEKHQYPNPVNSFRKLLVYDLLPIILNSRTLDVPLKQLHLLILKSIEFYVCWLTEGAPIIQGSEDSVLKPNEAWGNLFRMMYAMGRKLGWELSAVFNSDGNREAMCQTLWSFYRSTPLGNEESPNFRQLLYCTTVLLVESLYEYFTRLDPNYFQGPNQGNKVEGVFPLLLVRSFFGPSEGFEFKTPTGNSRKEETQITLPVTVSRVCPPHTSSALLSSFLTAVSCWELIHQTEDLRNAFSSKICAQLKTEHWSWLPSFVTDVLVYQGLYTEAMNSLQSSSLKSVYNPLAVLLKSAGILLSLNNHFAAAEQIMHVMASLPESGDDVPPAYNPAALLSNVHNKPPLHFMALTRGEIIQYCVSVLIGCLRERALRNSGNADMAVGHMIVLLQYEWPHNAALFEEIIEKIRRQGHFTYPLFVSYVIHVDVLEEFAYMATDQGGSLNMDIFPPSAGLATQRRMTTRRGGEGAREDFRLSMKRQMKRSQECIQHLISRFILQERSFLMQALNS